VTEHTHCHAGHELTPENTIVNNNSAMKKGYSRQCRLCYDIRMTPSFMRARNLEREYGLSVEEYDVLLEVQNGVCAICKRPERRINNKSKKLQALSVDHDHNTGRIRGLLCNNCNWGLGWFERFCEETSGYLT
jgi:Recombination endonuclease VII